MIQLCYELAGIVGVDPGPLTLRELLWMAESRVRDEWSRTSSVMALIANTHRDPRKSPRPFKPSDFDPTRQSVDAPKPMAGVEVLKQVFLPRNHPRNQDKESPR